MRDIGREEADRELKRIERKIKKEYTQALKEMQKKTEDYFRRFAIKDRQKKKLRDAGKITDAEYKRWRQNQMLSGKQYQELVESLSESLSASRENVQKIVSDILPDIYASSANFGAYEVEKNTHVDGSFTLVDRGTVKDLVKNNPDLLPKPKINIPKAERWNKTKLKSALLQGILQGEAIEDIAKRLRTVTDMSVNASIRNARTMVTGAESRGRVESYKHAQKMGIKLKNKWMASHDGRTRETHRMIDGEVRPVGELFSNDCAYPGDPNGEPKEVYNCFIPETKIGVDSKIIRSYKHRYEGEIISIKSALGVNFSCTPNHPILTDRGWVAAKFLHEGDNLIVTSGVNNEVSRRNPNINHAFPRIDAIHELFCKLGGKRTSDLRVNFHGDIPASEVEIVTQKGFLWSDVYTCIRKCINKFLFKYADSPLMCKCSFMEHFGRIMRATFGNIRRMSDAFPFIKWCISHSCVHRLRTIADSNIIFSKNTLNNLPANVILPSEIKHRLSRKIFLDNIVSVERSNFVGHVYNLQTDDNYYFVNSSITNNDARYNDIMAIAHNCRCRLIAVFDDYDYDFGDHFKKVEGFESYEEWKRSKPTRKR